MEPPIYNRTIQNVFLEPPGPSTNIFLHFSFTMSSNTIFRSKFKFLFVSNYSSLQFSKSISSTSVILDSYERSGSGKPKSEQEKFSNFKSLLIEFIA